MSLSPSSANPPTPSADEAGVDVRDPGAPKHPPRNEGGSAGQGPRPRQPLPRVVREGHHYHFVQVMRLLQALVPESAEPGRGFSYGAERIRITPYEGMVFPASDVRDVSVDVPTASASDAAPTDDGDAPAQAARVTVTFGGLYGVDSPLPYYFYEHIGKAPQSEPLRGLFDLFSHRLYALFYQACLKYRPALRSGGAARHTKRFAALAGLGTPHALDDAPADPLLLTTFAGHLGRWSRTAEGLEVLIEAVFQEPVQVVENVPRRVPVAERIALGDARLGETAALGASVYDESGKFRVELGPLSLSAYESFLPQGANHTRLAGLIRLYAPDHLDFDVRLTLAPDAIPAMRLGDPACATLGSTATLGRARPDAMARTVSYDA